ERTLASEQLELSGPTPADEPAHIDRLERAVLRRHPEQTAEARTLERPTHDLLRKGGVVAMLAEVGEHHTAQRAVMQLAGELGRRAVGQMAAARGDPLLDRPRIRAVAQPHRAAARPGAEALPVR